MVNSTAQPTAPTERPINRDRPMRLLIVDDHPIFRKGIVHLVSEATDLAVCAQASDAPTALQAMRQHQPDLVLLDISMPGTNGIELLKLMLAEQPRLLVIMISVHDESLYALRALRAGAKGYLSKLHHPDSILTGLQHVIGGGIYVSPQLSERLVFKAIHSSVGDFGSPIENLSDRELEVLQLMGRGQSTKQMAESLHLSVKTIETHRAHIKEKLGFRTSKDLVQFAVEWRIADEEGQPGQKT